MKKLAIAVDFRSSYMEVEAGYKLVNTRRAEITRCTSYVDMRFMISVSSQ